jgi:TRAP-type mannitol/chloroaromatic compound transport system permease large subunit
MYGATRSSWLESPKQPIRAIGCAMPTISWFFGISIRMYLNDHPPPHFHAYYESSVAKVDIRTGEILVGRLPPRIARFVEQ